MILTALSHLRHARTLTGALFLAAKQVREAEERARNAIEQFSASERERAVAEAERSFAIRSLDEARVDAADYHAAWRDAERREATLAILVAYERAKRLWLVGRYKQRAEDAKRRVGQKQAKLDAADLLAAVASEERDRAYQERDRWENVARAERALRMAERASFKAQGRGRSEEERAAMDETDARTALRALGVDP